MAGFSSEEILDLLYKKVAFGANKSGTSEQFSPAGETSTSFIAIKPEALWREANSTNVPANPPSTTSSYVQVYASHGGTQPASTTAVALCTANADAQPMPGQTLFKRSWSTGATKWIGPTFGAGYLVKVYVGPANWDGDTTDASITQVIFGSDANRDWYFDYEAGMLYWTPENEDGAGSFEDSDSWTTFTDTHVVYIAGYRYIGATGAGAVSLATNVDNNLLSVSSGELDLDTQAANKVFAGPDTGSDAVPAFRSLVAADLPTDVVYDSDIQSALFDGDFGSAGIMATNGSGSYSIVSDNSSNWNTAHGWGNHALAGYLTSETSHADVLVDGDFGTSGIMATNGSGSYSIVTDNSSNWNTAHGWGNHALAGYLTSETSHADVLVDGDFGTSGIMATNGSGSYSIVTDNSSNWNTAHGWGNHALAGYLTSETSHADVLVDGDFGTAGIMATNGSGTYSIVSDNSSNWNTAHGWGNHADGGYAQLSGATFTGAISGTSLTLTGNLTVAGTVSQTNSTEVNFNDTRLRLNVPASLLDGGIEDTAAPSTNTNVGIEIFNGAASDALSNGPLWVYNYSTDHWGASIQGSETTLDNVKAFKFDVTTSGLGAEANGTNDVTDLYATATTARSNSSNVRSVGAVSKCTIDITTDANDDGSNFAPVAAAANGYPIQHDLDTSSVFVFALKTHQAGGDGTGGAATAIGEPQPIFCKFKVLTADIVEVSVGITIENEKYDIIVIG